MSDGRYMVSQVLDSRYAVENPDYAREIEERIWRGMKCEAAEKMFDMIEASSTPVTVQIERRKEYDITVRGHQLCYIVDLQAVRTMDNYLLRHPDVLSYVARQESWLKRIGKWFSEFLKPIPYDGPRG